MTADKFKPKIEKHGYQLTCALDGILKELIAENNFTPKELFQIAGHCVGYLNGYFIAILRNPDKNFQQVTEEILKAISELSEHYANCAYEDWEKTH